MRTVELRRGRFDTQRTATKLTELSKLREGGSAEGVCQRVQVPNDLWRKLLQERQRLVSNPHAQECRVLVRRIFGESEADLNRAQIHEVLRASRLGRSIAVRVAGGKDLRLKRPREIKS